MHPDPEDDGGTVAYSYQCKKCSETCSLRPEELGELTRVEQLICAKEGRNFGDMVKVTCPHCGTSALVPRKNLAIAVDQPPPTEGASASAPFREVIAEMQKLRDHAFDEPGPLFNPPRREIISAWLKNFSNNIEAAQAAFRSGLDINGRPMSRGQLAESVERMCGEYEQGLTRLGEVCGKAVRQGFEKILAGTRSLVPGLLRGEIPAASPSRPSGDEPSVASTAAGAQSPATKQKPEGTAPDVSADSRSDPFKPVYDGVIPGKMALLVKRLDGLALKMQESEAWVSTGLVIVSLAVGIVVGVKSRSFWLGLGIYLGTTLLFVMINSVIVTRQRVRASMTEFSNDYGRDLTSTLSLFKHLRKERAWLYMIQERMKAIQGQQFSAKLNTHLSEAICGAILKVGLPEVLVPSRDLTQKIEKLTSYKHTIDSLDKAKKLNPIIKNIKEIFQYAESILENRKDMFALIDKMAGPG